MTPEQLIEEGRRLQRPCFFLRPQETGPVAAIWHDPDNNEIESTGHRCWITVDTRHIPGLASSIVGYISVFTDERNFRGGKVEIFPSWPKRSGTKLYAHPASVLPPIDAVFAQGSETVSEWIQSHGWNRSERYNDNFQAGAIVREYELAWMREYPPYFDSDIHAVLGGWHWPCADDDWYDLIDDHLLVFTIRDSEPWVEAWQTRGGSFRVIRRST